MITYLKIKWEQLKAWFLHSETILLARTAQFGAIFAAAFWGIDWSQVMHLDFSSAVASWSSLMEATKWLGAGLLIEIARRRHAPELATESAAKTKVAIKQIKKSA